MDTNFSFLSLLFGFAFYYPIVMAFFWITGGLYYYFRRERQAPRPGEPPPLQNLPLVSVLVPCFNEAKHIGETIASISAQEYADFEIIAINDGSSDDTGVVLDRLTADHPRLRVLHLTTNQGKATALRMGALAAKSEYLVCFDADATVDRHAVRWLAGHLIDGPRVGAVTGNPRIRNRSTLLGRLQVGEFSAIIGLIKRAQRVYGRLFTVSGVICAFRKSALHRIGFWAEDMATEDIDISWRLQMDHWDIRYEPNAICWILMPETVRGLWKQRLRWARGGVEVLMAHATSLFNWRKRRMWGVLAEHMFSVAWAYTMLALILLWAFGKLVPMPPELQVDSIFPPRWHGMVLGLVCLVQFATSMLIERRYEKGMARNFYWIIWYPIAFWMIGMMTTVVAVPKTLFSDRSKRGKWTSPDRGIQ